jgi:GDP-L-fucose synthase
VEVLVTGGSGMVGRNLVEALNSRGVTIVSPGRQKLDLTKKEEVDNYFRSKRPDAVVHCAGLVGGIQANISRPYDFAMQNISMGTNIVSACRENGVEKLLNLGSSCMYPKEGHNPLREDSILTGPLEPTNEGYAIAKIAVSRLCNYSNMQYGTDFKTLIPCNLYGKFDNFALDKAHLIPGVIHRMHVQHHSDEGEITIWGDGTARREFMYAADLADFVCFSLENYRKIPEEINVGMGFDLRVKDYYEIISDVIGFEGTFDYDLSKPTGMKQKLVDISRQKDLGWKPPTNTEEGISKTYRYFIEEWL